MARLMQRRMFTVEIIKPELVWDVVDNQHHVATIKNSRLTVTILGVENGDPSNRELRPTAYIRDALKKAFDTPVILVSFEESPAELVYDAVYGYREQPES